MAGKKGLAGQPGIGYLSKNFHIPDHAEVSSEWFAQRRNQERRLDPNQHRLRNGVALNTAYLHKYEMRQIRITAAVGATPAKFEGFVSDCWHVHTLKHQSFVLRSTCLGTQHPGKSEGQCYVLSMAAEGE